MSEVVTKRIPYRFEETDALATWLERQAEAGLFLRSIGYTGTAHFRAGEPRAMRYGVEFRARRGLDHRAARVEQLSKLGWQQLCYASQAGAVFIYTNEDLTQRSLPPEEGRAPLSAFPARVLLGYALIVPAYALIYWLGERGLWFYSLVILSLFSGAVDIRRNLAFKRRMDAGGFPDYSYRDEKKEARCERFPYANALIYIAFFVFLCCRGFMS